MPSAYAGDKLSAYTLDRYRGPWGEFLDAYGWAKFDLGPVPVSVKAGRHTVFWSESTTLSGAMHGIAYSQDPLDLAMAFANPGAERQGCDCQQTRAAPEGAHRQPEVPYRIHGAKTGYGREVLTKSGAVSVPLARRENRIHYA